MLCLLGRDVWAGGALSAGRTSDPSDDIAVGVQAALGGIGVAVGSADRGELVLRVDGGGDEGQHGGAEHGVRRGFSVAVYVGANEPGAQQRRGRSDLKHMAGTLGRPSAFDLLRKGGHHAEKLTVDGANAMLGKMLANFSDTIKGTLEMFNATLGP